MKNQKIFQMIITNDENLDTTWRVFKKNVLDYYETVIEKIIKTRPWSNVFWKINSSRINMLFFSQLFILEDIKSIPNVYSIQTRTEFFYTWLRRYRNLLSKMSRKEKWINKPSLLTILNRSYNSYKGRNRIVSNQQVNNSISNYSIKQNLLESW